MSGSNVLDKHMKLTEVRVRAYEELFAAKPAKVFTHQTLFKQPDQGFLIDIFVFKLATSTREIDVAVTNGMSDQRMVEPDYPAEWHRRELIQYFPICSDGHARRLHEMAWLPLFDGFHLDINNSIAWDYPATPGTPWKNAFFLLPLIKSHKNFVFNIEGDDASFLWHIPISDQERAFKQQNGSDALLDRMEAVDLPWVFDEGNRPTMVE